MDRLTRENRNILLVATTNFPEALDSAVLSRADHVEELPLPNLAARREIIGDTLKALGSVWKDIRELQSGLDTMAKASDGLDGRRVRKGVFAAMASDLQTAKDPNRLTRAQIEASFRQLLPTQTKGASR